jgi:hypothetical protein
MLVLNTHKPFSFRSKTNKMVCFCNALPLDVLIFLWACREILGKAISVLARYRISAKPSVVCSVLMAYFLKKANLQCALRQSIFKVLCKSPKVYLGA